MVTSTFSMVLMSPPTRAIMSPFRNAVGPGICQLIISWQLKLFDGKIRQYNEITSWFWANSVYYMKHCSDLKSHHIHDKETIW